MKKIKEELAAVEANENENRMQLHQMATQIDDRDEMIEKLQLELRKQKSDNRKLFKKKMKSDL